LTGHKQCEQSPKDEGVTSDMLPNSFSPQVVCKDPADPQADKTGKAQGRQYFEGQGQLQ